MLQMFTIIRFGNQTLWKIIGRKKLFPLTEEEWDKSTAGGECLREIGCNISTKLNGNKLYCANIFRVKIN